MTFNVGARSTLAALDMASFATSSPIRLTRSVSKVAPMLVPHGKHAALMPLM